MRRSRTGRTGGALRSENAGMSSEKHVRNMFAVNPRFPTQGSVLVGLVGPKPRARAVGDGQRVNIPVPRGRRLSEGVTQEGRPACYWIQVPNL